MEIEIVNKELDEEDFMGATLLVPVDNDDQVVTFDDADRIFVYKLSEAPEAGPGHDTRNVGMDIDFAIDALMHGVIRCNGSDEFVKAYIAVNKVRCGFVKSLLETARRTPWEDLIPN